MRLRQHSEIAIISGAFLFGFALFFKTELANVALIFFYAAVVFNYFVSKSGLPKLDRKIVFGTTLMLLISILISIVHLKDAEPILNTLGRRITYLLSPIMFLLIPNKQLKVLTKYAFKGLIIGGVLSSIFLILNILNEYYFTRPFLSIDKDILNFYHTNFYFTRIVDIHPSYYGMYLITALAYIYFSDGVKYKILNVIFSIIIIVSIIFLNSRIILFLFFVLHLISLVSFFQKRINSIFKTLMASTIVFVLLLGVLFVTTKSTYAFQRIVKETLWELTYKVDDNYNSSGKGDSRLARWHAALNLIIKKPLLGYGVLSESNELLYEYKRLGMKSAAENEYNAHNQYLGFTLEGGIFSFLALLCFLFFNLYISLKSRDLVFFFFVISVSSICFIENYLIRNAGVVFVAFFSSMFLFNYVKNDS